MRPIYVVNNFGQFNHLIQRALRDMDIDAVLVSNTTPPHQVSEGCRGIILGGGPSMERAGICSQYIDLGLPVLGICLGLHIIATKFGGIVHQGPRGDTDQSRLRSANMMTSFQDILTRSMSGLHMPMKS